MLTLTSIADLATAISTATAVLAFTVARTPIVAEVAVAAYAITLDEIDLGTDAAALGIEVGAGISGYGIPAGAVVASISGNSVFSDLTFTATGDGSAVTFAPPVSAVTVTARSYDAVRIASVVLGGSGASRTVTVTPATGKSGRATIEVKATVGDEEAIETFLLTITAAVTAYTVPASWEAQEVGPVIDLGEQGEKGTATYMAPYPACKTIGNAAYRPAAGVSFGSTGMVVGTVKIEPKSADADGMALVTIGLIPIEKSEDTDSEGEPVQVTYRRRWENIDKPLNTAPIYFDGAQALSEPDLVDIEMWRQEPEPTLKRAFKYQKDKAIVTLSAKGQHFAKKLQRGGESYFFAYPVVSRVGITRQGLDSSTMMNKFYKAPPGFPKNKYPAGWFWVGIEDDSEQYGRTGPIEGTVSFRGVSAADRDLYRKG